jgi:deoxyribonuclease-4
MFGSHLSISGGMHNAVTAAQAIGFDTVQVFTKNQQQWKVKPIEPTAVATWKQHIKAAGYRQTVSHDSYLINLASPDETLWRKSIDLFAEELRRCEQLGIPLLVTHPGAHVGSGEEAGLRRVADALNILLAAVDAPHVTTCLEITAGQGSCLGCRLEHLADIIGMVKRPRKLAICLDTAHLFAAGYDFRGRKYAKFVRDLDKTVGVKRVKVLHLNDSKKELGSRVDRHEHIGLGRIGLSGFTPFVNDKAFRDVPKILETPKEKHADGRDWDVVNLEVLKGLMK